MEQLRDIKGLVEVTDYSLYYLLGLSTVVLIIVGILGYLLYKKMTQKTPMSQQKLAKSLLKELEITDAKGSVYTFSHLAQYAVTDALQEELQSILKELEPYKYKKEVPQLAPALKERMQKFIKEVTNG